MGEGENVVLRKGIVEGESQLIVMPLAVDGIQLDVAENVIHPAHVPLEAKAQSAHGSGFGDHGEGSGFFRNGHGAGEVSVNDGVHLLQESNGFQVFTSTVFVGQPLSSFTAEIVIQHGGYSIHPETICMVPLQPEAGIAQQERTSFTSGKVKHAGSPLRHFTTPGIRMLVACRSIKLTEADFIPGEVGRYPVQNDTDPCLMAPINEGHQSLGRAITAGGGVIARHLISPGHIQRMLHHRQQLHMGIAHFQHIGN